MAMINNIRKRSGLMLILLAGSLLLFLLGDNLSGGGPSGANQESGYGSVDGKTITQADLAKQKALSPAPQYEQDPNKFTYQNRAWENAAYEKVLYSEFDKLGLAFTNDGKDSEQNDMFFGVTLDPNLIAMMNRPDNPKQLTKDEIIQRIKDIESPSNPDTALKSYWNNQLKGMLMEYRKRGKYEKLMTKSVFVNDFEAKLKFEEDKKWAEFNYLFVPFASIQDSTINERDLNLAEVITNNKEEFKVVKPTRSIDLVYYNIFPSSEDTAKMLKALDDMSLELIKAQTAAQISSVTTSRVVYESDPLKMKEYDYKAYNDLHFRVKSQDQDTSLKTAEVGPINRIYGPYISGKNVEMFKIGEATYDTTFNLNAINIVLPKAKATKEEADSLLARIKNGEPIKQVAFDVYNKYKDYYGRDSSKITAFGEYENKISGEEDLIYSDKKYFDQILNLPNGLSEKVLESDACFYITEITEAKTFESVEKKYLQVHFTIPFYPSEKSQNEVDRIAFEFFTKANNSIEAFNKAVEEDSLTSNKRSLTVTCDQDTRLSFIVDEKREIVREIFDESVSEPMVLPQIFTLDNKKVVVAVTGFAERGQTLSSIKDDPKLRTKAYNNVKSKIILDNLATIEQTGTLTKMAVAYNEKYKLNENSEVSQKAQQYKISKLYMKDNQLSKSGGPAFEEPEVVGTVFGLKKGKRSSAFIGENGIYIVEVINKGEDQNDKGDVEDKIRSIAKQEAQSLEQSQLQKVREGLLDRVEIEDKRHLL